MIIIHFYEIFGLKNICMVQYVMIHWKKLA